MSVEVIVALAAAWSAKSSARLGFGGDSAVELLSAIVVLWRFRSTSGSTGQDEEHAARLAGALRFVVAGFVVLSSGLSLLGYSEPRPSLAGIILLIVAAVGMPWLANQKRKLAAENHPLICVAHQFGVSWHRSPLRIAHLDAQFATGTSGIRSLRSNEDEHRIIQNCRILPTSLKA